jgi:hypothetical protein
MRPGVTVESDSIGAQNATGHRYGVSRANMTIWATGKEKGWYGHAHNH